MQNIEKTILSQYASARSLCTIISGWNQALDPSPLVDQWFANVWNLETAVGYGLDVWGRIVGVSRVLKVADDKFFGWTEDVTEETFGYSVFYNGIISGDQVSISDDAFRQLIKAKALKNITDGSVLSLNAVLMTLFYGQGDAWVEDGLDMSMTYVFGFSPSLVQRSIIQNSGVLPRPSGVSVSYSIKGTS
ncbi:DUF2612 domain-containing protein [Acetobacter sp.]|uniref:DUF2612 domain-containing protein n=1 Tax=Acetobacter sp. TaxID=440 RepID=UPI0039E814C2